jgi:hypothetical protein
MRLLKMNPKEIRRIESCGPNLIWLVPGWALVNMIMNLGVAYRIKEFVTT